MKILIRLRRLKFSRINRFENTGNSSEMFEMKILEVVIDQKAGFISW